MKSPSEARSVEPRVSVALCTFNGALYLREQLASIKLQDRPIDELVVSDDGSSDDTVAELYAAWTFEGAPPLRLLKSTQRLGVAANFERALRACTGDLIFLCDQDDRWHTARVGHLVDAMRDSPGIDLIHGDARLIDGEGNAMGGTLFEGLCVTDTEIAAIRQGRALDVLLDRNLVTGATVVFRRSLLDRALPIPNHWLHDEWLGVVASLESRLGLETTVLLDYRQHSANQIGVRPEGPLARFKRGFRSSRFDQEFRRKRAAELLSRLREWPEVVPSHALLAVEAKLMHHSVRAALPMSRPWRLFPVLREWFTGRYDRYGRGWRGALKDLVETRSR